jgi:hypothetical protein
MGVFVCPDDKLSSPFNSPHRPILLAFAVLVCLLLHASPAEAQLAINELYYDHPGGDEGYEFIEVMNVGGGEVALDAVAIEFHNGSGVGWEPLWAGGAGAIAAGDLFVVGGRFVTPPVDAGSGFSLQNGPDAVRVTVHGVQTDLVAYGSLDDPSYVEAASAPGVAAGRSLARISDGVDSDNNLADFKEATPSPGTFNVPRHDAAVTVGGRTQIATVLPPSGLETMDLRIVNNGMYEIASGAVGVEVWDSAGTLRSLLDRFANVAAVAPGGWSPVSVTVSLAAGYHWLEVYVDYSGDERAANNAIALLRRVGGPRLLVSEVLSSPREGCPQFVELFNAGAQPVAVAGFQLRDKSHSLTTITPQALSVPPGGCLVVTPDADGLLRFFPAAPAETVVQHTGTWPTLNRTGSGGISDSVVVADPLSLTVDAIAYPPVDSDYEGRSLERIDLFGGRPVQTWVLSIDPSGASPGRRNDRSLLEAPAPGALHVSPRTFSPSAGETTTASIDAVAGLRAVVGVYDVAGRRVSELGSATVFPAVFVWDGRDANGRLLSPGFYIVVCELFAEAGGRLAAHKVVVGCGQNEG